MVIGLFTFSLRQSQATTIVFIRFTWDRLYRLQVATCDFMGIQFTFAGAQQYARRFRRLTHRNGAKCFFSRVAARWNGFTLRLFLINRQAIRGQLSASRGKQAHPCLRRRIGRGESRTTIFAYRQPSFTGTLLLNGELTVSDRFSVRRIYWHPGGQRCLLF